MNRLARYLGVALALTAVVRAGEVTPLKEITGQGIGFKSIDEVTDADIRNVTPYPGETWQLLKGPKRDFGKWLSIFQMEASYHDTYDPVRSPVENRCLMHMGVDLLTGHIDGGGSGNYRDPMALYTLPPEAVNLIVPRWVTETGRGLIPSIMTFAINFTDGQVFYSPTYDGPRQAPFHCQRCYSSPKTIEGNIARLRGNMATLGELATWNGKTLVMFNKEESKWMTPAYRDDGTVQWGCYCPYCQAGYRKFLAKRFGTIEQLNAAARMNYKSFEEVLPPPYEMAYQMPVLFHYWMQYREHVRLAVIDDLTRRCGAVNVQCDSTFQFGMWYHGVNGGYNPYLGAVTNDIVNVDLADGSLNAYCIGVAVTVDAVLREHPEKTALVLWGGYPPEEGIHPTLFQRRFAEMFGHVTNLRGSMFLYFDTYAPRFSDYHCGPRQYPEMSDAYAWWAAFGENQADLIAGLKTAMPQIASYWARTQTPFDPRFRPHERMNWITTERSKLWNWNFLAFWLDQYPVHCLFPEQVEVGASANYKALYVLYGPRNTDVALNRIKEFHDAGGYVYGAYDALTRDLQDVRLDVFRSVFGCEPAPGGVEAKPPYLLPNEYPGPQGHYEIVKAHPALPPVGTKIPFMSGLQVVKPLPGVAVYATFKGQPCIVGTSNSLYVGTDIAVDLSLMLPKELRPAIDEMHIITAAGTDEKDYRNAMRVLTGFATWAGVQRPVTVTKDGHLTGNVIVGLQEKPGVRLLTLTENRGIGGAYELALPVNAGDKVWDLTKGQALTKGTNGSYGLNLEGYAWRVILVADDRTVKEASKRQETVEFEGRGQPYRLTRYFFVRETEHGRDPSNNHFMHNDEDVYLPAAVIVPPRRSSPAIAVKVKDLQELIRRLSRKHIANDLPEPSSDPGALLPIVSARQAIEAMGKGKNVLWIGSGKLNPRVEQAVTGEDARRQIRAGRIATEQTKPWRDGGNVMVVSGENEQQVLTNLDRLLNDLVFWFNTKRTAVPVAHMTSGLMMFVESLGWKAASIGDACLELTRPDGKSIACWVYSQYDDNFAPILMEMRQRKAGEPLAVYSYNMGLKWFRNHLTREGWKDEKNGFWSKGEERLNLAFASTDWSLNNFQQGLWPEKK